MTEITNIYAQSDNAVLQNIAHFIKHHRLQQNKTQSQLAIDAGINRSTLVEFEKGHRSTMITFIQLLRALNLLYVTEQFNVKPEISPIQLAEMAQAMRKRASKTSSAKKTKLKKNKSNW